MTAIARVGRTVARGATAGVLATGLVITACAEPDDTLFTPPPLPPAEIAPGLFRATWNPEPDVVRGFTADGRIVYRARHLAGLDSGWALVTLGLADGDVREEARIYRLALRDTVGQLVFGPTSRLLVSWRTIVEAGFNCAGLCPAPSAPIGFAVRRLPLTDGAPLSALPTRVVTMPNHAVVTTGCMDTRFRLRPAEQEALERHANPYGPVEPADASAVYYSDGETLWRYDPADPAAAPDSLGPGAFPALSPDGRQLAAAVPLGLDSSSGVCFAGLCPCRLETVTISTTGWAVVLYDPSSGAATQLTDGLEPVFDPLAPRVVVRRPDALYWVDLVTGNASEIPQTEGAYAPAVAPDGSILAFTAERFGNPDVFYVRIR
jgi:hypothetical protein